MLSLNQLPQAVHQEENGENRPARFISFFAALLCMAVCFLFLFSLEEDNFICHSTIACTKKLGGQMKEQSETPLLINLDTQMAM